MEVGDKKLLVLHLKGCLVDCYHELEDRPYFRYDAKVNNFYIYRRPGSQAFVEFCLDNFVVGVWSSCSTYNARALVDYTFGKAKDKLAFIWSKHHSTEVSMHHPRNSCKPLVWKELRKLWNYKLPWRQGTFGPSNTILIDDDPYVVQKNPPNTAIIVKTYCVTHPEDNSLGKLRKYLEGLADTEDVQQYIEEKPFRELHDHELPMDLLKVLSLKNQTGTHERTAWVSSGQNPVVGTLLSSLSNRGVGAGSGKKDEEEVPRSARQAVEEVGEIPQHSDSVLTRQGERQGNTEPDEVTRIAAALEETVDEKFVTDSIA